MDVWHARWCVYTGFEVPSPGIYSSIKTCFVCLNNPWVVCLWLSNCWQTAGKSAVYIQHTKLGQTVGWCWSNTHIAAVGDAVLRCPILLCSPCCLSNSCCACGFALTAKCRFVGCVLQPETSPIGCVSSSGSVTAFKRLVILQLTAVMHFLQLLLLLVTYFGTWQGVCRGSLGASSGEH